MIRYNLKCDNGHEFECLFRSFEGYKLDLEEEKIECPYCDSIKVIRLLSVPNINNSTQKTNVINELAVKAYQDIIATQKSIKENFRDVGNNFYKEALSISNKKDNNSPKVSKANKVNKANKANKATMSKKKKQASPSGIYGNATSKEVKKLKEKGIIVGSFNWIKQN